MTEPGVDLVKRPRGDVRPAVLDGELVDDRPTGRPRPHLIGRAIRARAEVVTVLGSSGTAATAGRAGRRALRVGWTALQGMASWSRRAEAAVTHGLLREQVRLARAAGDREALAKWAEQLESAKDARAKRLRELPGTVLGIATLVGGVLAGVLVLLVAGGVGAQVAPGGTDWAGWWASVGLVLGAAGAAWHVLVTLLAPVLAVPLVVLAAWREGRRAGTAPMWLMTPQERAGTLVIDERAISAAIAHLGIPAINAYLKGGGVLQYTTPAHRDGAGVAGQVRVPMGATAEEVAGRRPRLAANLQRATLEVWPTVGDQAGLLDFWIADPDQLSAGAGDWPLLHDGEGDVFAGVPIGRSQRGSVIETPLFESNWLIGGRPGQGKTAAMRTVLLGAALDPTCELWVYVMGESPDFAPLRPRLTRYAMGMDDEVAAAALAALRDALAEMERRGKVLGSLPGSPPKTSRRLANRADLGLHPLIVGVDECHELFMHPKHGKEAAELAIRLIKRGRKYGVILVLATQSPTKDSIPREVTRNVSAGVAFAVADHVANDGLLGAGKYKAGIRATDLRMRTDRGTSVAVGVTDEVFELVRWFYIPFGDGQDAVTPVVARACAAWERRGRRRVPEPDDAAATDHLQAVADALRGEARVRTAVLLGRLIEADAEVYEPWGFQQLASALADAGVPVGKSGGQSVVRSRDVLDALAQRTGQLP